jgi:hypothetical protein
MALEMTKAPWQNDGCPHWMIVETNRWGRHDVAWGFDGPEDAELFAEKYEQGGVDLLIAVTRHKQPDWHPYEWRFLSHMGEWARDLVYDAYGAAKEGSRPRFTATLKALRDGEPLTPTREAVLQRITQKRLRSRNKPPEE